MFEQAEATRALASLEAAGPTWSAAEQTRLVRLLVARVDYDGLQGKVSITFEPQGLKTLASELSDHTGQEQSA